MIYTEPNDWKQLEAKVAELLRVVGYEAYIAFTLKHVRGCDDIDVYATRKDKVPHHTIICECKYWDTKVPQSVVNSLVTVMSNSGANFGYVISKLGFQSGAFDKASFTNIEILTWHEFQDLFENEWLKQMRGVKYNEICELIEYTEYLNSSIDKVVSQLSYDSQIEFNKLKSKYEYLGFQVSNLNPISVSRKSNTLNKVLAIENKGELIDTQFQTWEQYFEKITDISMKAIIEFRNILKR